MFDSFKTISLAFTGKLKEEPTLRKYFWVFLSCNLVAILILAYNAFMSLNYYSSLLENFAGVGSRVPAYVLTFSIALVVFFLIQSFTGTVLDYIGGNKEKTNGHEPLFFAVVFSLVGLLALDISANLSGVNHVSHSTTKVVMENSSSNVGKEYDSQVLELEKSKEPILKKYYWKGKLYFEPYPVTRHSKTTFQNDKKKIDKIDSQIMELRDLKREAMEMAMEDYKRDLNRYDSTVNEKKVGHTNLVWFAYGVAILLCFITSHYNDKVFFLVGNTTPKGNVNPVGSGSIGFNTNAPVMANNERLNQLYEMVEEMIKNQATTPPDKDIRNNYSPIGYNTPTVPVVPTVVKNGNGYLITCKHCGVEAIKHSKMAKYCSEECRGEAYEKRTGKKLKFKK